MQWNKVKTILIVLLVIVNGILGSSIAIHAIQNQLLRNETAENVTQVLSQRGITCKDAVFSQDGYFLASGKIMLDMQQMRQFASGFFQEEFQEKQDGEQTSLTSEEKSISFDVNGVFSGTIKEELPLSLREANEKVKTWMKAQSGEYQLEGQNQDGSYVIRVYRRLNGVRLEEPLQFIFLMDGTVSLSGRWTFGTLTVTSSYSDSRDTVAGSVLRFLNIAQQIKEVDSARACYCLVSSSSKSLVIEPGWCWQTDQGEYLSSSASDFLLFKE